MYIVLDKMQMTQLTLEGLRCRAGRGGGAVVKYLFVVTYVRLCLTLVFILTFTHFMIYLVIYINICYLHV